MTPFNKSIVSWLLSEFHTTLSFKQALDACRWIGVSLSVDNGYNRLQSVLL
jgi:hypothetical protein